MKIQSIVKKQAGIAHLAIIAVLVVSLGIGAAGFAVYKNKGPGQDKLKADAAGAYSSICTTEDRFKRTFNLVNDSTVNGVRSLAYKSGDGRTACFLVVNQGSWGSYRNLTFFVNKNTGANFIGARTEKVRYYTTPQYFSYSPGYKGYGKVAGTNNPSVAVFR